MKYFKLLFFAVLFSTFSNAQVGVNATTIDPSAALDIQYGTSPKGLLTPRMTTLQRTAITAPADGLIVYDTDLKSFYHFQKGTTPSWVKMSGDVSGRTNFKRIRQGDNLATVLASELTAGGGASYKLDTKTFYEINGVIVLNFPIDLNNAYVAGVDASEDVLFYSGGTIFKGNTGGSIKNITLKGAKAFEITGPGDASTESLLVQNTIIVDMTTSVGSISGLGLYFGSVVQFLNNINGVTYSNIGHLLLDNQAWLDTNSGTFEKFTGKFGLIQKASGFSHVNGADVALDVSDATLDVGAGTLEGTVFIGTTTAANGYINPYPEALTYPGYNFNNAWYVDSPGISRENDASATGNIYKNVNSTGTATAVISTDPGSQIATAGTSATNLFRFGATAGRLTYKGKKKRAFQANATISFKQNVTGNTTTYYVFYFAIIKATTPTETVTPLPQTQTYIDANRSEVQAFPISGTIVLESGESVGLFVKRMSGGNLAAIDVYSYNLSLK